MSSATQLLRAGPKKRIHLVGSAIRQNKRTRTPDVPHVTVQTSRGPVHARRVEIHGPVTIESRFDNPLDSGAVVWLATNAEVTVEL